MCLMNMNLNLHLRLPGIKFEAQAGDSTGTVERTQGWCRRTEKPFCLLRALHAYCPSAAAPRSGGGRTDGAVHAAAAATGAAALYDRDAQLVGARCGKMAATCAVACYLAPADGGSGAASGRVAGCGIGGPSVSCCSGRPCLQLGGGPGGAGPGRDTAFRPDLEVARGSGRSSAGACTARCFGLR